MRPLSELDSAYLAAHAQSRDLHRPVVGLPPVEMRVLTVRQPWAWAIIHGQKSVENRVRSLGPHRGPVAIHAGLMGASFDAAHPDLWPFDERHVTGRVIGVVDLVDTHVSKRAQGVSHAGEPVCFDATTPTGRLCSPWAMEDHHLVLANPRPLARPIPAKGRLGLWRPGPDLLAQIQNQIEETP